MFGKKHTSGPDPKTGVDYEKLGRAVEANFVKDYVDYLGSTPRQIWSALVRGVFIGLGTVLGATLFVALLLGILETLGGAPVIGHYIQDIANAISEGSH